MSLTLLFFAVVYSISTTGNAYCNEARSPIGKNDRLATTDYFIELPFVSNVTRRGVDQPEFGQKDVTDLDELDLINSKTLKVESDYKAKGKGVPLQGKKALAKDFDPNGFPYETDGLLLGKVKWNYPMKNQNQQESFYKKDLYENMIRNNGKEEFFGSGLTHVSVPDFKINWFPHLNKGRQEIDHDTNLVGKLNTNAEYAVNRYIHKAVPFQLSQSNLGEVGNARETFRFGPDSYNRYPSGLITGGSGRCDPNLQAKPLIININSDCSGSPSRMTHGVQFKDHDYVMPRFKYDSTQQDIPKYQVPKLSDMAHFYYM